DVCSSDLARRCTRRRLPTPGSCARCARGRSPDRSEASLRRTKRSPSAFPRPSLSSEHSPHGMWRSSLPSNGLDQLHGIAHAGLDALVILLVEQLLGDEIAADTARDDAGAKPLAQ